MSSPKGPSLAKGNAWKKWEAMCLVCLREALENLRQMSPLPEHENSLNQRLNKLIQAVADVRYRERTEVIRPECPNPHADDDEASANRLTPAPDLRWGYRDTQAGITRDFVIECKRLRCVVGPSPLRVSRDYVREGIVRFHDKSKGYGRDVKSGAMVGYVQSGGLDEHLCEVNKTLIKVSLPELAIFGALRRSGISELKHTFPRPFGMSPFDLLHFWVDLRDAE